MVNMSLYIFSNCGFCNCGGFGRERRFPVFINRRTFLLREGSAADPLFTFVIQTKD